MGTTITLANGVTTVTLSTMPFVKLDIGILNSTLWVERDARELFITALLMAEPKEFTTPVKQIETKTLTETGFEAPPGWYGFIPSAGIGIVRRAGMEKEEGMVALEKLASPETESRSSDFEGRRLIRINGGYLVLNFMKYRDKDHTAALRQQRLRDRKKASHRDIPASHRDVTLQGRDITHSREQIAEAEPEIQKQKPSTNFVSRPFTLPYPPKPVVSQATVGMYNPNAPKIKRSPEEIEYMKAESKRMADARAKARKSE